MEGISPKINLAGRIEASKLSTFAEPMRLNSIEQPETSNFKNVLTGLVDNLNQAVNAPDQLAQDAMQGKADVHDVMAAIAQSEIQLNTATAALTKVIQSYEKIMQIQI